MGLLFLLTFLAAIGSSLWQRYLRVWTAWNHVRTIAPLAAAACFTMALIEQA